MNEPTYLLTHIADLKRELQDTRDDCEAALAAKDEVIERLNVELRRYKELATWNL